MQFDHELNFLEHFGMPLAPEQKELFAENGSTYALCPMAVPDPIWIAREGCYEPLHFEADDGSSYELLLPTVFERWPTADEEDEQNLLECMEHEFGWDPDALRRLPGLFGRGYEPWNEHSICMCCEQEPAPVRIWSLWPLEPARARFLAGQLDDLFEEAGWLDTYRHYRILECEGYSCLEEALEVATAPVNLNQPRKIIDGIRNTQASATGIVEALQDNPVKELTDFKPSDFELQLEDELEEAWTRLQARRSRFLAALPRVLPQLADKERYFAQWP
jgi:hypothetical protein